MAFMSRANAVNTYKDQSADGLLLTIAYMLYCQYATNTYRLPNRPPKKQLTHMKSHEAVYTLTGAPVYMLKTPYMLTLLTKSNLKQLTHMKSHADV